MSDIKKELRLIATLDDSAFKRQMQGLKKELGSTFSLKASDLGELRSAFKGISKEFSDQLRQVLNEYKSAKGPMKGGNAGLPNGTKLGAKDIQINAREVNITATNVRLTGMSLPSSGGPTGAPGGGSGGGGGNGAYTPGNLAGRFPGAASLIGGIGAVGAAGAMVQGGYSTYQGIRRTMAEREFRPIEDTAEGRYMEGAARESGRGELTPKVMGGVGGALSGGAKGALGGAAVGAGIGSVIPVLGTAIGAAIGATIGGVGGAVAGGFQGAQEASSTQGELRVEQIRPLVRAVTEAQRLNPMRMQAMAGGGIPGDVLNGQMRQGAEYGYKPDETLQQLLTAKQTLGNAGASEALPGLQRRQRMLGIDVGTGAENIETMAGAGGGTRSQAISKQIETIKKGVAAGLDVSKSGAFLKTVSAAVSEGGLGRVDTDLVSSRLGGYAKGIAGEGDVTDTTLAQAKMLSDVVRQQSTAESGFSGIGNISNIQESFKNRGANLDTGTMLSLMNMSSDATDKDYEKVVGGAGGDTYKLIQDLKAGKQRQQEAGLDVAGVSGNMRTYLGGKESGFTTEGQIRRDEAMQAGPLDLAGAGAKIAGVETGVSGEQGYKLMQAEALQASTLATEGLKFFDSSTRRATEGLEKLEKALKVTAARFDEMLDNLQASGSKR